LGVELEIPEFCVGAYLACSGYIYSFMVDEN